MNFDDYARHDAISLGSLIASGQISAAEALQAAQSRADSCGEINAITARLDEYAQQVAASSLPTSLLSGVPFLLKDLHLELEGAVTTMGSRLWANLPPATGNSTLTQRYLDAGLVIFGKTSTPELGLTVTTEPVLFGPTRNPWNTGHSAGGSSGGAAAAVAAGIVPAAHASDGGGSIRIPASCCGLYGLKPTRARTPMGPKVSEGWNGQSINHVVSRSVRDSACLLDLTAGEESGSPYAAPAPSAPFLAACQRDPKPLRIAISPTGVGNQKTDAQVVRAVEEAGKLCEQLGHSVDIAAPEIDMSACGRALLTVIFAEVRALLTLMSEQVGHWPTEEECERGTLLQAERAKELSAEDLLLARRTMQEAGRIMGQFHQQYDVYVSPTLASPPVPIDWLQMNSEDSETYAARLAEYTPFTALFNQTGQPSASLPLSLSDEGLPIGVMFTTAFGEDELLLALSAQIERQAPWGNRYPFLQS